MTRADTSSPTPPGPPTPLPNVTRRCDCIITPQTVATSPPDRTRTTIGVGEEMHLTVSPGPATWSIRGPDTGAGGTLFVAGRPNQLSSSASATTVRFTAGNRPGVCIITATGSGCSCSIILSIVAPSKWIMEREFGTAVKHHPNRPDCGFLGRPYIQPYEVNFYRIEVREKDSLPDEVTGSFARRRTEYHGGYPEPDRADQWRKMDAHMPGLGTRVVMLDQVYSGDAAGDVGDNPPFTPGTISYPIEWEWRIRDSTSRDAISSFFTQRQDHEVFADGTCTTSKGGHTEQTMFDGPAAMPFPD